MPAEKPRGSVAKKTIPHTRVRMQAFPARQFFGGALICKRSAGLIAEPIATPTFGFGPASSLRKIKAANLQFPPASRHDWKPRLNKIPAFLATRCRIASAPAIKEIFHGRPKPARHELSWQVHRPHRRGAGIEAHLRAEGDELCG